jgi:hypothetical protein
VEEETKMSDSLLDQARHLLDIISNNPQSEIISRADEFLLFLNHLSDLAKKSPKLATQIQPLNEIIYGLESNPEKVISRHNVQEKLRSFLSAILK